MSEMTPACDPIIARCPIRTCPAMAACPPTWTKSSSTVEPEMPTCATMTQHRPRITLWPICTRLSRRQPAPITVSCDDPRSIVVLAPTSTSSSRITLPSWGTDRNPSLDGANPKPSCPIRAPGWMQTRAPRIAWLKLACAPMRQSCPIVTPVPIIAQGPIRHPGPISTPDSINGHRSDLRRWINERTLSHNCGRMNTRRGRWYGIEQCSNPCPTGVWFGCLDRHCC